MWLDCSRMWSFLVALSLATIADAGNHADTRGAGGQREFVCREEGYHPDPQNCMIYYRCVLFGNSGPLTKYSFECGPGTVFSPLKGNVCTHPYESGRKECDGTNDDSNKIDDIDSNNVHGTGMVRPGTQGKPESQSPRPPPPPPPPTCPVCGPSSVTGETGTTAAVTPSSVRPSGGAGSTAGWATSTESIVQAPNKPNLGIRCTGTGFMADPYDCAKFYRCVDEGKGSFKRYDFTCGIGTIWDPEIDTCNHPWAVKRAGCNVPTDPNPSNEPSKESGPTSTTVGVTPSSTRPGQGAGSTSGSISNTDSITQPPIPSPTGTVCTCRGFMGDPRDCKRFYRCLDDGNGKFTRQDFMCGIGTIWNPQISACDDPSKTNRPECNAPTGSNPSQKPSYLPSSTTTAGQPSSSIRPSQDNSSTGSSISTTESINQVPGGSGKPSKIPGSTPTTSGFTPSTVSPSRGDSPTGGSMSTTESINQDPNVPTSGPQCTSAGFMADPKDCKKFYRCVDEGNGSYKRYEFGCGIGTAWDQELQTCNYPWAVNRDLCKIPTESNTSNAPSGLPGPTETTAGVTASSVSPTQQGGSTGGLITSTESVTQSPNQGSSGLTPSEVSPAVPPSGGASEVPPSEGSSQVPPLDGSSEASPPQGSPDAPTSTNIPSSESSTGTPISEGSTVTLPAQVTSDGPSSGDASEAPTTVGSSEVPPSQSSSEPPTSQTTSETPPSEISSEVAPSGSSLSPGQGAPGVSSTTVPSTTDGSLAGPTTGDTQGGSQCNEVEHNCGNQQPGSSDSNCTGEGFFANENDCTKFYRCVGTGQGSYTKYEFACGSGTAWDQTLLTCNYIHQVNACDKSGNNRPSGGATSGKPADITSPPVSSTESSSSSASSSAESTSSSSSSASTSSSSSSESTSSSSLSESTSPSSSESTSEQSSENTSTSKPCDTPAPPIDNRIVCNKEGFYAHPSYCNKFYRCVDNGNGFNVYHFDCPPGTIYDPSISVCNYPSSVYPPRNCGDGENSGETTGPSGTSEKPEITTTGATVTPAKPEGESTEASTGSTPEGTVSSTPEATTESLAETSTDTSQGSTSQEDQTSGSTTGISAETSTEASQSTTSQEEITTAETATEQSQSTTPLEQSSTEESASSTQAGTESSATTTSSTEETTNDMIQSTTSQEEQSSTIESGGSTESGISDAPTSTNEPTTLAEQPSTESQEATTVAEQQSTDSVTQTTPSQSEGSNNCMTDPSAENCNEPPVAGTVACPIGNLTGEQIVLVCPTGFRQHPKYCNMFYQCTMDSVMDVKILTFHCPDDTIFDDKKIQCLSEKKASQPCKGVKAGARVYRRVESSAMTLINIEQRETLCPSEGYYPHNGQECSNVFYKCKKNSSGVLQGYLYECPENFVFWTVSRRCERASSLPMCSDKYSANKNDNDFWKSRWQLPVEDRNRSARLIGHH